MPMPLEALPATKTHRLQPAAPSEVPALAGRMSAWANVVGESVESIQSVRDRVRTASDHIHGEVAIDEATTACPPCRLPGAVGELEYALAYLREQIDLLHKDLNRLLSK